MLIFLFAFNVIGAALFYGEPAGMGALFGAGFIGGLWAAQKVVFQDVGDRT